MIRKITMEELEAVAAQVASWPKLALATQEDVLRDDLHFKRGQLVLNSELGDVATILDRAIVILEDRRQYRIHTTALLKGARWDGEVAIGYWMEFQEIRPLAPLVLLPSLPETNMKDAGD